MTLPRAWSVASLFVVTAAGAISLACSGTPADAPGGAAGQTATGTGGGSAGTTPVGPSGGTTSGGSTTTIPTAGTGTIPVGGSSTGTAGAGGTPSSAGAGGASGTAGTSSTGGGGRPSGPSAGCKAAGSMDEPGKAIEHDIMVTAVADKYKAAYTKRKYYTTLPTGYDATKQYPMMFYGQGCGQTTSEGGPFSGGHFASEMIYIQLIPTDATGQTVASLYGAPGCFEAGTVGQADSPDGPYFDQVLSEVEASLCTDTGKVYVAGWSSGAWLSNWLACARGNVITGTAAGSGGMFFDHGTCTGGPKSMVLDGDAAKITQDGHEIGAMIARDILAMAAGAGTMGVDTKLGPDTCQVYAGTNGSVAYCPVGGGHGGPLNTIADAAWAFWTAP